MLDLESFHNAVTIRKWAEGDGLLDKSLSVKKLEVIEILARDLEKVAEKRK